MSSSPSSSNSDKTFTVDPSDNLSYNSTYKIRLTTGVKDTVGNTLSSQYQQGNGFNIPDAVFHNGVYWQREYKRIGVDVDGLTYCSDLEYGGRTNWQIPNYDNLIALYNSPNDNISVDSYLSFYPFSSFQSGFPTNKCGGIDMTGGGVYGITNNSTGCAITSGWGTLCMSE